MLISPSVFMLRCTPTCYTGSSDPDDCSSYYLMSYATLTLVIGLASTEVIPTFNRAVAQRPLVAAKGGSQFTRFSKLLIIQGI